MKNKFYITTTLPYVNSEPHIGFALEIVQADAIARWQRVQGQEVLFNTGTDEHGLKIYRKALEFGQDPQAYCDFYAAKFDALKQSLNLSYTNFIRTTDAHHMEAAQEFWRRCAAAGDIYKKNYKIKYCVGCELEKTESELADGKCPVHPNLEIEFHEEENYFFRFSRFQKPLLELYEKYPEFVVPKEKLHEIKNFVGGGLEDFSISRLKAKMPWGIAVPDDGEQVMYVWFDALINYVSTLGWPSSAKASEGKPATSTELTNFDLYWPGFQVAGKDNLRQQSAMWQAMLLSAGLEPSARILIHGFITANGQKMSKSLGNVIDPFEIVAKYGTDALRYYLLAEFAPFEDGDFTIEKFEKRFNGDLANGLGNLVARVATLLEKNQIELALQPANEALEKEVNDKMAEFRFDEALRAIWRKVAESDEWLTEKKPWKSTEDAEITEALLPIAQNLFDIGRLLAPFMPATGEKIVSQFSAKKVIKSESLFPRIA